MGLGGSQYITYSNTILYKICSSQYIYIIYNYLYSISELISYTIMQIITFTYILIYEIFYDHQFYAHQIQPSILGWKQKQK